jgi:hypothetical protein
MYSIAVVIERTIIWLTHPLKYNAWIFSMCSLNSYHTGDKYLYIHYSDSQIVGLCRIGDKNNFKLKFLSNMTIISQMLVHFAEAAGSHS